MCSYYKQLFSLYKWLNVGPVDIIAGVKVNRNAAEHRSGAWKFKPGVFGLQNY